MTDPIPSSSDEEDARAVWRRVAQDHGAGDFAGKWTGTLIREIATALARWSRERDAARQALGPYSKHEIGQSLAGAINNLRQIVELAKEGKRAAEARANRLAAALQRADERLHDALSTDSGGPPHDSYSFRATDTAEACPEHECAEIRAALDETRATVPRISP